MYYVEMRTEVHNEKVTGNYHFGIGIYDSPALSKQQQVFPDPNLGSLLVYVLLCCAVLQAQLIINP